MTALTLKDPTLLKDKCYVAGEWIGGAATIAVTNPVDDSVDRPCPEARRGRDPPRDRGGGNGAEALGEEDRQGARRRSCANGST